MHTGRFYRLSQTVRWSSSNLVYPFIWAVLVTVLYTVLDLKSIGIPTLPMSLIGVAVAFYLGFKNNASYDRLWEARKIWGAIVNASRAWAYGARDLVTSMHGSDATHEEQEAIREELVHRHVAWMDALRHQLRQVKSWEHQGGIYNELRRTLSVPEYVEDLNEVLRPNLLAAELEIVTAKINPAAHIIAMQSKRLAELRSRGLLDGFSQIHLQEILQELIAQQGKAERIKNFPFPRQYATVNNFFAKLFAGILPFAMLPAFDQLISQNGLSDYLVWLTVPFSALVSWVFLTTDKIGDWSENPFEGLSNDVPISSMSRGIERDIRQMVNQTDLPEPRSDAGSIQL